MSRVNLERVMALICLVLATVFSSVARGEDESGAAPAATEKETSEPVKAVEAAKAPEAAQALPTGIAWAKDLDDALKTAKADGKLAFLEFGAEWCPYCKMFQKQTLTDGKVKAELAKFVSLHVDADKDRPVAAKYEVGPIPALLLVDAEGKVVVQAAGFQPPEMFLDFLAYGTARRALASDPKNSEAAYTVAVKAAPQWSSPEQRLELTKQGLELVGADNKERRGRLLLARAQALASQEKADIEAAAKDVEGARSADPDNALGIREEADWLKARLDLAQSQGTEAAPNMAALDKVAAKFLEDYPAGKVKNQSLRNQALALRFRAALDRSDPGGGAALLEQYRTENKDLPADDLKEIDDRIAQLKEAAKEAAKESPDGGTGAPKE